MAIETETRDCTSLSDADFAEMADVCTESANDFGVGALSKQAEDWVLVTLVRENEKIQAFAFSTLERIGGTPCVLIGIASIKRTSKRDSYLRAIVGDQLRRAVMAFPDEDVLVGARLNDPAAFEAYRSLDDIVPRPGYKPSGEERAWGRRLAKRFAVPNSLYNDRSFLATGDSSQPCVVDHTSAKPETLDPEVVALFTDIDIERGDTLVAFGWAMAEDLAKLA
ncbi:MAG: hypothetical protein WC184_02600 [Acidimicrobiia bacterium]